MSWTILQMISLGSLLLLCGRPLCAGTHRCIDTNALKGNWSTEPEERKSTFDDVENRSLTPWTYETDKDEARHPRIIQKAKCATSGCMINKAEDHTYNSVEVNVRMMVLYKSQCAHNPKKYKVTVDWITVAVACTCARPKFSSSDM